MIDLKAGDVFRILPEDGTDTFVNAQEIHLAVSDAEPYAVGTATAEVRFIKIGKLPEL
jgi:hypothetical protein